MCIWCLFSSCIFNVCYKILSLGVKYKVRQADWAHTIHFFVFILPWCIPQLPLIPALHMWQSLCAEREIRGKDDKSILQITRLCVYYSELEHDILSSSMQVVQLFFLILREKKKEKTREKRKRKYHSQLKWKKKGHNCSWGWRGRVSPIRNSHLLIFICPSRVRGWFWLYLAEHVDSHTSNDCICRCQECWTLHGVSWRLKSTHSGWFKQNMIVMAL